MLVPLSVTLVVFHELMYVPRLLDCQQKVPEPSKLKGAVMVALTGLHVPVPMVAVGVKVRVDVLLMAGVEVRVGVSVTVLVRVGVLLIAGVKVRVGVLVMVNV